MKAKITLTTALLAGLALSAQDPLQPDLPDDLKAAHATFVELCAPCHGVNGDGKGTTELDRPARSCADGGFSFGNTSEALSRTLRSGIPGTPMPAFGGQVSDGLEVVLAKKATFK